MEYPFYNFLQKCKDLKSEHKNSDDVNKAVVLVEGSSRWHFPILVQLYKHFLSEDWNFYFFHTRANHDWISKATEGWECPRYVLESPTINAHVFNELHKDIGFWDTFKEDYILTLEADSILCQFFDNRWLQYDMIGAPCGENGMTYNGGCCLRRRTKMIEALTLLKEFKEEQEDVFFSKALRVLGAQLPNQYDAALFAVENFYYAHPFGFHGIDKSYIHLNVMQKIVDEIRL